jgi:hypothetical protein
MNHREAAPFEIENAGIRGIGRDVQFRAQPCVDRLEPALERGSSTVFAAPERTSTIRR